MDRSRLGLLTIAVILQVTPVLAQERQGPPLGSPDFYPSPERPIGFRGDGNGHFPGATPVTEWREGTPQEIEIDYQDQWGNPKKTKGWDLIDDKSVNIVWKTEMPSWGNGSPIVVGDRIFSLAEPNLLVCTDANSGTVLWQRAVNPWACAGKPPMVAETCQELYDIWRGGLPYFRGMTQGGTVYQPFPHEVIQPLMDTFRAQCLERIVDRLMAIDPAGKYDVHARSMLKALDTYLADRQKNPGMGKKDRPRPANELLDLHKAIEGRIEALSGIKVPLVWPWEHMVAWCMVAPVSDGESVYVSFGQGQTACFDLNGKIRWARWFQPSGNRTPMQSPLLADHVLVVMHDGGGVLHGLDARTGKSLWEAPTKGDYTFGSGGGYYVGGHTVMRLDGEAYVVTQLCNIIRVSDGKSVGALPFDFGPSGGPTMAFSEDIVVKSACGDAHGTPLVAFRLKVVGKAVKAEKIWQTEEKSCPGYQAQVVADGKYFMTRGVARVLDMSTGEVVAPSDKWNPIGNMSNIMCGRTLLWTEGGTSASDPAGDMWGRRRSDGKVMKRFHAADLSDPQSPRRIDGTRLLGGVNMPRMPAMEKYAPELYAHPLYWGQASGRPAHFISTDTAWMPLGNRLFLQTVGHMYCIGDPSVAFDWNPESRPAKITKQMKATRR